jgi:hypothetical protein
MKEKLTEKWKVFNQGVGEASQRLDQASAALKQCEKQLDQNLGARAGVENILIEEYGEDILNEIAEELEAEAAAAQQQQQVAPEATTVDLTDEKPATEVTEVEAEEISL